MKLILSVLFFLLACGADFEGEPDDYGALSEPIVSQIHDANDPFSFMTGVMYEQSPLNGLTYQWSPGAVDSYDVFVPFNKALTFKTAQGPCTAAQFTAMRSTLDNLIIQLSSVYNPSGWTFARNESTGLHTVQCLNLPTSPTGTNSIRNYSRTQCTWDQSRLITAVDSRINGNLLNFTSCAIQIDVPDVYARGANATEDSYLLWHAVAHGVMKTMGIGAIPGNTLNVMANETITPIGSTRTLVTTGASCRTKNYAPGGAGQWAIFNLSTTAHCDNN